MGRLFSLSMVASLSAFVLIVLGNYTRVSDSSASCAGEWPKCQGSWIPPLEFNALVEWTHRTMAVWVSALVFMVAVGVLLVRGFRPRTKLVAWVAVGMVALQSGIGATTVWSDRSPSAVTTHLGLAEIFFAMLIVLSYLIAFDRGAPGWIAQLGAKPGLVRDRLFLVTALVGAVMIFSLFLTGGFAGASGAGLACPDWPNCGTATVGGGGLDSAALLNISHRAAAVIGVIAVALVVLVAFRRPVDRAARALAVVALGMMLGEAAIGAAYVLSDGGAWWSTAHLALGTLLWFVMVGLVIVARRSWERESIGPLLVGNGGAWRGLEGAPLATPVQVTATGLDRGAVAHSSAVAIPATDLRSFLPTLADLDRFRGVVKDYVALTKPGIQSLLLITTVGAMLIAAEGIPAFGLLLATVIGGSLAAGGANVLNCFIDRDIDSQMSRTRHRATAAGRITPRATLSFGLTLTVASVLLLTVAANPLAAALALAGNIFYVVIYTWWLKRRTPQNIVIGGAAGAFPPLVGWAAVTGDLSWLAWGLFAVIFFWTPPHFWALALLKMGEYGRAAVPMLPVVAGEETTRKQIVLYTVLLTAVGIAMIPMGLGWIYTVGMLLVNGVFLAMAIALYRDRSKRRAREMFFFSLWYLTIFFAFAVVDRLILA